MEGSDKTKTKAKTQAGEPARGARSALPVGRFTRCVFQGCSVSYRIGSYRRINYFPTPCAIVSSRLESMLYRVLNFPEWLSACCIAPCQARQWAPPKQTVFKMAQTRVVSSRVCNPITPCRTVPCIQQNRVQTCRSRDAVPLKPCPNCVGTVW